MEVKPKHCAYVNTTSTTTDKCKRKIKITDFKCAYCKLYYCQKHRLPEQHNCPYNFKKAHEDNAKQLADKMRCVASKIDLITSS